VSTRYETLSDITLLSRCYQSPAQCDPCYAPESGVRFQLWTRDPAVTDDGHELEAPDPSHHAPFTTDLVAAWREGTEARCVTLTSGSRSSMIRALSLLIEDGWNPSDCHWSPSLQEWTRPELPVVEVTPDA